MSEGLVLDAVALRLPGADVPLFAPLSVTVRPGEIVTLSGASGAGKSMLLDFAGGHLARDIRAQGRILLNGRDLTMVAAEDRHIGVLFQDALLFPHLSVAQNLAFGLKRTLHGKAARIAAIEAALISAGLQGFGDREPARLSGGEQMRVALLRTLLAEPEAILLDEPFSRLDAPRRASFRTLVFARIRAAGIPALLVTHDATDAKAAGGPVFALQRPAL